MSTSRARAERHSHADFMRALTDRMRRDAVDADPGEQQGDRGEAGEQHRANRGCVSVSEAVERPSPNSGTCGCSAHFVADGRHDRGRIARRAHDSVCVRGVSCSAQK